MTTPNYNNWLEDSKGFAKRNPSNTLESFHAWVLFSARNLMIITDGELEWLVPNSPCLPFLEPIKDFIVDHYKLKNKLVELVFFIPLFEFSISQNSNCLRVIQNDFECLIEELNISSMWDHYDAPKILRTLYDAELKKFGFTLHETDSETYLESPEFHKYQIVLSFDWDNNFNDREYAKDLMATPEFNLMSSDIFIKTKKAYIKSLVSSAEQGQRGARQALIEYTQEDLDLLDPQVWAECGVFLDNYMNDNLRSEHNIRVMNTCLSTKAIQHEPTLQNKASYSTLTLIENRTSSSRVFRL